MRSVPLAVVCWVLWGCAFDDSAPSEATINCEVSEQCPTGWRCAPVLGRCVQRSDLDVVGPTLSGAVAPPLVRPGDSIVITVTANEPLLGAPEVEVRGGTTVRPVPPSGDAWTFVVPPGEPDGLLTFFGSAEDSAGNGTRGVVLGAALVDGSPPTLVSARVSPERVAPTTIASVVVNLSEEVRPGARLLARHAGGAEVARVEAGEGASTLRFELLPPAGVGDGELTLHLEGLLDLAGNASPTLEVGRLTLDGTAPVVGPLGLAGRRFSAQPGFERVTVPIDLTGASLVQVCLAADCRDATSSSSVTFPVVAGANGPRIVRVRARDEAGNTTEVAESVDFDFQAPALEALEVEPATIGPGGQVIVSATFDEPLAAGVALVVEQDDGGWSDRYVSSRAGSRLASFLVRMPQASQASATFLLRLEGLGDDVANASGALDAGSFLLDADPPVFLAHDAGYPRRYSRQPGHDVVVLPARPVAGAERVEVCLDSACVEADGGPALFPVSGSASEGGHAVSWRAFDAVGNSAISLDTVTFDFTAPRVLSAGLGYTPPPGCPLTSVSALTRLGGVSVSVTTDEPLLAVPPLDAGVALGFLLTSGTAGDQSFAFSATAPSNLTGGGIAVSGWLTDDVGNGALVPVAVVDADTTPPPPVAAAVEDGFVYTRVPFGAQRTNSLPLFTVEAGAGTFEPGVSVQVWNSEFTTTGLLLTSLRADGAGALPISSLPPADLSRVYFKQYDRACNAQPSTPLATAVPRTNVVLTLGAKVPGQLAPNPSRYLEEFGTADTYNFEALTREWGGEELASIDAKRARSRSPLLRWQIPAPRRGARLCAAYHPGLKQTVLLTGDRRYRRGSTGWADDGQLPGELEGNCASGTSREGPGVLMVAGGAYFGWTEGSAVSIIPVGPGENGAIVAAGGAFMSVDIAGSFTVYRGDPDSNWREVLVENVDLPNLWVESSNVAALADMLVLVADSSAWILTDGFTPGAMRWEQLPPPPASAEATAKLGASALVFVSGSQTWIFRATTGAWEAGPPCPLQARALSAYEDADGMPSFLAEDWSVAHFDGTAWSLPVPPAPQTGGYQALGHSPLHGTAATQGAPPRLIFHGAWEDGSWDTTWSWDGSVWTSLGGTVPASPSGVATTEADGGVILVGLERGTTTMSTWRFRNDAWQQIPVTNRPPARTQHALSLDSAGRVLVQGGRSTTTNVPFSHSASLITASDGGLGWNDLNAVFLDRARHAMGFDPLRRVTVLFGGEDVQPRNDTFEFGSYVTSPPLAASPPARVGASLVWDPTFQALVLVGGEATADTWVFDGAWRDLTSFAGAPPGTGVAAFDPTTRAIMALAPEGEAFLAPFLPVGHRFFPGLSGISPNAVLGGSVMAVFGPSAPANLRYSVLLSSGWTSVGGASSNAPVALNQLAAQRTIGLGLRIAPASLDTTTLEVDYFELSLRYR